MTESTCRIDKCKRTVAVKWCQLCGMHYARMLRYGNPEIVPDRPRDGFGYSLAHKRVVLARGRAGDHPCADCGKPAHAWSLNKETVGTIAIGLPSKNAKMSLPFSDAIEDYSPRCRSCHARLDSKRGELNHRAKLTNEQVIDIFTSAETHKTLAERYGISISTIEAIRGRRNYRSITGSFRRARDKE